MVQNGFPQRSSPVRTEKKNMKDTLIAIVAALGLAACASAPAEVTLPVPKLAVGTTFETPCSEHGSHTQTITGTRLGVIYDISGDDGTSGEAAEEQLLLFMEMYGIVVDTDVEVR